MCFESTFSRSFQALCISLQTWFSRRLLEKRTYSMSSPLSTSFLIYGRSCMVNPSLSQTNATSMPSSSSFRYTASAPQAPLEKAKMPADFTPLYLAFTALTTAVE